jgi:hypothetical protein
MPVAGGPNTLGESNLVFAYDTGDVSNSYIGAPTTNICTGADYSIFNDGATNIRNQTFPLPFKPGYEVVKVAANTPGTYGQSILWTATYSSSPTTATNSVYAWLESGTYVQVGQHWHPWNYGSPKYIEKGKWVRISETYAINEGGSYSAAGMVYSTDGVAYFCMPQYELKPYMTPFINFSGTRSATQGLLPLVGNSTIDLTNVSFNSNAQMVFDGTNDYTNLSVPPLSAGASTYTIEAVFKANSTKTQVIWEQNSSSVTQHQRACMILISNGYGGFNGQSNDLHAVQYSAGVWYHWVIVVDKNTGTNPVKIYVNGTLSAQGDTSAGATNLNVGTYGAAMGYKLNANDEYFDGEIPVAKIYNRALTAQEVRQNYQQYKTRFNLS